MHTIILTEEVRRLRLERAWTQADLAAKCGSTAATISRIENGVVIPRVSTLRRLAEALDVAPTRIFTVG